MADHLQTGQQQCLIAYLHWATDQISIEQGPVQMIAASYQTDGKGSRMPLPDPIFIGFRAKIVEAPSGFGAPEVCSMSACINTMPPDWETRWDWNRAYCYNSEGEAAAGIPVGSEDNYVMFAYRMYPWEFDETGSHPVDLPFRLADGLEIAAEPYLSAFSIIGYDIANGPTCDRDTPPAESDSKQYSYSRAGFGCSPLSCNGCAEDFPVNQYYLLNDLNTALRAAETFGIEEPEPGPFYIYQVLRKMTPDLVS